jgi:tellurite resistance protein
MYYVYEQSGRNVGDNQTFFRDLKRKGYIRPIKLKANVSTSRQFTVNMVGLDGSMIRSDKREVLYTTKDHGKFDEMESEKITDLFRQNCATIGRYKQQMNSRVKKVSEEMLMK